MSLVQTKTLESVQVMFAHGGDPSVHITYRYDFDDPNDDKLPVSVGKIVQVYKYLDSEVNGERLKTDLSEYEQEVQDICNALWKDNA